MIIFFENNCPPNLTEGGRENFSAGGCKTLFLVIWEEFPIGGFDSPHFFLRGDINGKR